MDSCVLVVTTVYISRKLHFGKELPTEREFTSYVHRYDVAVYKVSGNNVPLGFESLFGSDPAHFIVKYSSMYKHYTKNLMRYSKSHEKNKSQDKNSNGS